MKSYLSILMILTLSACSVASSSSDDDDVVVIDDGIDDDGDNEPPTISESELLNTEFAGGLNDFRTSESLGSLEYDERLALTAEEYATERGTTGTILDVGDLAVENGYTWDIIRPAYAEGDFTTATVLEFWQNNVTTQDTVTNPDVEDFGIAKIENGDDDYWGLVTAKPSL